MIIPSNTIIPSYTIIWETWVHLVRAASAGTKSRVLVLFGYAQTALKPDAIFETRPHTWNKGLLPTILLWLLESHRIKVYASGVQIYWKHALKFCESLVNAICKFVKNPLSALCFNFLRGIFEFISVWETLVEIYYFWKGSNPNM